MASPCSGLGSECLGEAGWGRSGLELGTSGQAWPVQGIGKQPGRGWGGAAAAPNRMP